MFWRAHPCKKNLSLSFWRQVLLWVILLIGMNYVNLFHVFVQLLSTELVPVSLTLAIHERTCIVMHSPSLRIMILSAKKLSIFCQVDRSKVFSCSHLDLFSSMDGSCNFYQSIYLSSVFKSDCLLCLLGKNWERIAYGLCLFGKSYWNFSHWFE